MGLFSFSVLNMIVKLVLAVLIAALIGLERETHGRPAGLRTHILVCLGSTLFTICSFLVAKNGSSDPGRITAQIVTGIGFLGAGTIIHQGNVVRGLTTAASIWTVAAIGVGIGIGGTAQLLAVVTGLLVFATLNYVPKLESALARHINESLIIITISDSKESLTHAMELFSKHSLRIISLSHEGVDEQGLQSLFIRISVPPSFDWAAFNAELAQSESVVNYRWM